MIASRLRRLIPLCLFIALTVAACSGPRGVKDTLDIAAVPDSTRRLTYALSGDTAAVLARAVNESACLLLSGYGGLANCREAPTLPDACNDRDLAEVKTQLTPAFEAIPGLRLTSPSVVVNAIPGKIPGAVAAVDGVYDARRSAPCRTWRSDDGACLAIHFDALWILVHAPPQGDRMPDRFEVFLSKAQVCSDRP